MTAINIISIDKAIEPKQTRQYHIVGTNGRKTWDVDDIYAFDIDGAISRFRAGLARFGVANVRITFVKEITQ